jgi:alkylation response protein AidB-like acyl-CoA dehydrogenase
MGMGLDDDEAMLVEVKPTVREREHANEYPEAWIEQMKRIGIYGLAIPEEFGGARCRCRAIGGDPGVGAAG